MNVTLAALTAPSLFFLGTASVALPILIHLLARRRFKRIRWAAVEFLLFAERRNRRRIRLEEWILLALRCLIVLLLGLMVARPFLPPAGAVAFWGMSRRTERMILLDDSLSMSYESDGESPFSRGKAAVRRLVEWFRREAPDDTVSLIRMTAPDHPVETSIYLDEERVQDLLSRVEGMSPTQRAMIPSKALHGAVEALKKSPDVSGAVVYVISDFQRADWCGDDPSQPSSADDKSLLAPLVEWAADDRGLRLTLINVADKDPRNVAILNAVIRGGPVVAGAPSVLSTVVTACGASEYENIPLQTSVGGVPQPPKTIRRLEPGQRATVDLEVSFPRPGFESVRIDASVDGLPADNVRYYAEEVFEAIRVLLVNGEPGEIAREDEVALMATALRPEGLVFSGVETTIVDEGGLDGEDLSRFHLVVLANVYRLSDVALGSLEEFTQNGGGLLVFLGDQVDADWYNASLYRNGEGILPAELGAVIKIAGQARLVIENRLHPVFLAMAGAEDPLGIGRIPFFDYIECRPFEGTPSAGETDVDDNAETGPDTSLPAQVIARFEHAEKHPALIERSFGKGRTILITTSADKEWNFWPDHPTFLPAMLELVRHVARRPHRPENQWVGLPLNVPLDAERYESRVMVRTPAYPAEQEIAANAVPLENGSGLTVPWEHTETSGIYQFVLTPRSGGETTMLAAVNLDPRESDLTRAGEEDLRKSLSGASFEYVEDVDGLVGGEGESRTELWRIVLLTAVAMLMLEQTLAFAWGKRR